MYKCENCGKDSGIKKTFKFCPFCASDKIVEKSSAKEIPAKSEAAKELKCPLCDTALNPEKPASAKTGIGMIFSLMYYKTLDLSQIESATLATEEQIRKNAETLVALYRAYTGF